MVVVPSVRDQVEAARKSALWVPAPELSVLVVTGKDRQTWLNGLITCDLAPLAAGQAAYGLAVAQKGRILSDLYVVLGEDRLFVAVPTSALEGLRASLEHYLIMEDAEITSEQHAVAFVHGPGSADVRGEGMTAASLDLTGLGGTILLLKGEPDLSVTKGDEAGWEALRLERGIARFGVDFDTTMYPQEAGIEKRAVSFSKGCYLGQEVVCMLEMRGHVKRKLVPVVLGSGEPPAKGTEVTGVDGAKLGEVSSAVMSPTLGVPVGLAMLKYARAQVGEELRILGQAARVVERPA
jgi:folate-binding protein YgfZ